MAVKYEGRSFMEQAPGLVVKGWDSSSKGPEFEYRIMDVNIFTLICC